jgi:hypothetical protein
LFVLIVCFSPFLADRISVASDPHAKDAVEIMMTPITPEPDADDMQDSAVSAM